MPLESFKVENFKSIGKPQSFKLSRINLIFGPNSAGKSTLIQSLLLYCNLIIDGDDDVSEMRWGVELGGFANYVHLQDLDKIVTLKSVFSEPLPMSLRGSAEAKRYSIQFSISKNGVSEVSYDSNGEVFFKLSRRVQSDAKNKALKNEAYEIREINEKSNEIDSLLTPYVNELVRRYKYSNALSIRFTLVNIAKMYLSEENAITPQEISVRARTAYMGAFRANGGSQHMREDFSKHIPTIPARRVSIEGMLRYREIIDRDHIKKLSPFFIRLQEIRATSKGKFGPYIDLSRLIQSDESFAPIADEIASFMEIIDFGKSFAESVLDYVTQIHGAAYNEIRSANHIGPVRWHPTRRLYQSELKRSNSPEHRSWLSLFGQNTLLPPLNLMLKDLGMEYEIKISEIYKRAGLKRQEESFDRVLELFDLKTNINVAYRDVGTGISQVVPILINLNRPLKILSIEQPELHLHPALQSKLMDVFIKNLMAARARNRNRITIIETHSEHMVLRLRKRVRESGNSTSGELSISASDVNIIYTLPTENGLQVVNIEMDDDGDFIDQWPGGFFEERLREI